METGLLIALGFGVAMVVLALALARLFPSRGRRDRHDLNASPADGRAAATWLGMRAGNDETAGEN